jgi:cell division protein FtsL
MNTLTLAAVCLLLASAFLLYGLSYDTRQVEARVHSAERNADRLRTEIAILKAERAHLARPERIEPFARQMGLQPIIRHQIADPAETKLAGAAGPPATATSR